MMREAIIGFPKQLVWKPEIKNPEKLGTYSRFVICGMGGSHLAADIVKAVLPENEIIIHRDYGLPYLDSTEGTLFIFSSYSGNTEETLDAYDAAKKVGLPMAAIAVGGTLLEAAKQDALPYVQLPDFGIQPRSALGLSLKALASLMRLEDFSKEIEEVGSALDSREMEEEGKALAQKLSGRVPVIYASERNTCLAYNWKIKLNETGKIPAFYNVLPELNHNEMNGFDVRDGSRALSEKFHFVILREETDHPLLQKRMEILESLYKERGLSVSLMKIEGRTHLERIIRSALLGDWTALYIAELYGLESEQVPMVENFKKLMKS